MKFQNPSLNFFGTDRRTNGRTNAQAETNMLPHFFKVGDIKTNFGHLSWAVTLHLLVRSGQNSNSIQT